MAAIPYGLTRADLLLWLLNIVARLQAHELVPMTNAQQDAAALEIDALRVLLEGTDSDALSALTEYHAAIASCVTNQADVLDAVQSVKYLMRGVGCSGAVFALAGFSVPVTDPVSYVALTPSDLAVVGFSNGTNKLTFTGNNTPGLVSYIVMCQIGESVVMEMVGSTTRQKWTHSGVVPGVRYIYKIFARSASNDSAFSNEAMVYGV